MRSYSGPQEVAYAQDKGSWVRSADKREHGMPRMAIHVTQTEHLLPVRYC